MKKGTMQSNRCRLFVLDEADELIGSDSIKNIRSIYGRLLAANAKRSVFERLQVCFFSATLHSKEVRELSETIYFRPLWIDLRGQDDHCFIEIDPATFADDTSDFLTTDAVYRQFSLDGPVSLAGLSDKEVNSEKTNR